MLKKHLQVLFAYHIYGSDFQLIKFVHKRLIILVCWPKWHKVSAIASRENIDNQKWQPSAPSLQVHTTATGSCIIITEAHAVGLSF